jgi:hypothetical protein
MKTPMPQSFQFVWPAGFKWRMEGGGERFKRMRWLEWGDGVGRMPSGMQPGQVASSCCAHFIGSEAPHPIEIIYNHPCMHVIRCHIKGYCVYWNCCQPSMYASLSYPINARSLFIIYYNIVVYYIIKNCWLLYPIKHIHVKCYPLKPIKTLCK